LRWLRPWSPSSSTSPSTPGDGRAVFFVVEPGRDRLRDLAQRVRDGRRKPITGHMRPLTEAVDAFTPDKRTHGKTVIRVART
jgi:NADPH:quinone reductase-like Zn-dependent oxidoreductase